MPIRRGAHIYAEIAGYGNAADAFDISKPDAGGQVRAMRIALADARANPDEMAYLNAHGTATAVGDVVETHAIKQSIWLERARPAVSSTKALHGHLMGATGAVEMVAAIMAMRAGRHSADCTSRRGPTRCAISTTCRTKRARLARRGDVQFVRVRRHERRARRPPASVCRT